MDTNINKIGIARGVDSGYITGGASNRFNSASTAILLESRYNSPTEARFNVIVEDSW